MADFCEREIVAIEETFSESFVFLCDFHREQSWTRWVSKTDNGVGESKDKVLAMLRRCAHSCWEDQFEVALESLTNSVEWKAVLFCDDQGILVTTCWPQKESVVLTLQQDQISWRTDQHLLFSTAWQKLISQKQWKRLISYSYLQTVLRLKVSQTLEKK